MQKKKWVIKKNELILWFIAMIYLFGIFMLESISSQIIVTTIFVVFVLLLLKVNILHPSFLFTVCFYLYSISYPLLYVLEIDTRYGCSQMLLRYEGVALVIYILIVGIPNNIYISDYSLKDKELKQERIIDKSVWRLVIFFEAIIVVAAIIILGTSGISHKSEIYSGENFIVSLILSLSYIFIMMLSYIFIVLKLFDRKINWILIGFAFISFLFLGFASGERDIAFTMFIVMVITLYYCEILKIKHLVVLAPLGVAALLFSTQFKYFFLTGNVSLNELNSIEDILHSFFNAEFIAASRNMQLLLQGKYESALGWGAIIEDFVKVLNSGIDTSITWFNKVVYHHENVGYGFTLVGEGYVISNWIGIFVVFSILAFLMKRLYENASKNPLYLVMYINTLPLAIYSIRGNLSSVFSPFLKHIVIGAIGILILNKMRNGVK